MIDLFLHHNDLSWEREAFDIACTYWAGWLTTALLHDLYAALEVAPDPGLAAEALSPSGVTSSAAESEPGAVPVHGAIRGPAEANGKPDNAGPSGLAALSSSQLRSVVAAARGNRGPHRVRWEPRQRRAWDELNRRGEAA